LRTPACARAESHRLRVGTASDATGLGIAATSLVESRRASAAEGRRRFRCCWEATRGGSWAPWCRRLSPWSLWSAVRRCPAIVVRRRRRRRGVGVGVYRSRLSSVPRARERSGGSLRFGCPKRADGVGGCWAGGCCVLSTSSKSSLEQSCFRGLSRVLDRRQCATNGCLFLHPRARAARIHGRRPGGLIRDRRPCLERS
jgi:hypothetical protein